MCSIAGACWLTDASPSASELERLVNSALSTLRSRGPDESAVTVVAPHCAMGGNRLIIRGGRGCGSMPFQYGRNVAFYNGEIYNFQDWVNAPSDGEAILPAYARNGLKCFGCFDGEFAVSLWDASARRLILARDPFGTKPLYFSFNGRRVLWASSATAINSMEKHPYCARTQAPTFHHSYAVQEPYTSFSGIWLVPPGHALLVSESDVDLVAYEHWAEASLDSDDPLEAFHNLEVSLKRRLDYKGTIGIPLSGGIDSGIIAFAADLLGIKYHVFSVVEMFGQDTEDKPVVLERLDRLRHPESVTILACAEAEYEAALRDMYLPDYYDSEKFDSGNIPMHTVFAAMHQAKIRVAVDGSGGDELFHGYRFRNDFRPVPGWPRPWKATNYFYSLFTTLLDYTAKADRAGAHFSIETRFPFQTKGLLQSSLRLKVTDVTKWPLRRFLLERLDYGMPTTMDISGKVGFSLKHKDRTQMLYDMQTAWCRMNGLAELPNRKPLPFPFAFGRSLY